MTDDRPKPPTIEELEAQGLAPWKTAGEMTAPYMDGQVLFGHVKGFCETFLYFENPILYDVLAAWILHTWLINHWRATGPLLLIGPVSSGKTTVIEVLEELAFRGVRGGSMSNATMFRLSDAYMPTLLIDESQIYAREEWAEAQSFLNERYRKGGKVWRMEGEGKNMVPRGFNAYGATALAQSNDTWEAMRSRAIVLNMEKGAPKEQTLTDQFFAEGRRLRAWLKEYRKRWGRAQQEPTELDHKLATLGADDALSNQGVELNPFPDPRTALETIKDHRVREIGWPLLAVAPINGPRENIQSYLEELEKSHEEDSRTSYLAEYVQALDMAEKAEGGVSAREVQLQIATIRGLKITDKGMPRSKAIMNALRTLGFQGTLVGRERLAGIRWDELRMVRLRLRFALLPLPALPPSVHEEKAGLVNAEGERKERKESTLEGAD